MPSAGIHNQHLHGMHEHRPCAPTGGRGNVMNLNIAWAALAAGLALMTPLAAQSQQPAAPAQPPIKIGIVTFLTGPAAAPFGIPGRNATEILIESLNAGKLPAPYNQVGLGGAKIEAKYVDEAGSTAQQVTEFRNLVQRDKVDV